MINLDLFGVTEVDQANSEYFTCKVKGKSYDITECYPDKLKGFLWYAKNYITLYLGPSPPSGTCHSITWWGHFIRHVWQCTQLDGLRISLSLSNLYTSAGQKYWQGWQPNSSPQLVHFPLSENIMCGGSSSRWRVPERSTAVGRSIPPLYVLFSLALLIPS